MYKTFNNLTGEASEQELCGYQIRAVTKDGRHRWVHPSLSTFKFYRPDEYVGLKHAAAIGKQVLALDYVEDVDLFRVEVTRCDVDLKNLKGPNPLEEIVEEFGFDISKMGYDDESEI